MNTNTEQRVLRHRWWGGITTAAERLHRLATAQRGGLDTTEMPVTAINATAAAQGDTDELTPKPDRESWTSPSAQDVYEATLAALGGHYRARSLKSALSQMLRENGQDELLTGWEDPEAVLWAADLLSPERRVEEIHITGGNDSGCLVGVARDDHGISFEVLCKPTTAAGDTFISPLGALYKTRGEAEEAIRL